MYELWELVSITIDEEPTPFFLVDRFDDKDVALKTKNEYNNNKSNKYIITDKKGNEIK